MCQVWKSLYAEDPYRLGCCGALPCGSDACIRRVVADTILYADGARRFGFPCGGNEACQAICMNRSAERH